MWKQSEIKFGWLIEYNMRNISPKNSYSKCGGETSLKPSSKKSKLSMSQDQQPNIFYNLHFFMTKAKVIKIYLNWGAHHLLLHQIELF